MIEIFTQRLKRYKSRVELVQRPHFVQRKLSEKILLRKSDSFGHCTPGHTVLEFVSELTPQFPKGLLKFNQTFSSIKKTFPERKSHDQPSRENIQLISTVVRFIQMYICNIYNVNHIIITCGPLVLVTKPLSIDVTPLHQHHHHHRHFRH